MAEEIAGLGFRRVELGHGIRMSLVPGILQAVEEGVVTVGSVHNFCPLPNSVQKAAPNLFEPSSPDARERDLWRRYTEQTFDFATKVGARRVVMHSGSVRFFLGSPEERLERWVRDSETERAELPETPAFLKRRDRVIRRIRRKSVKALERVAESYAAVLPKATELGLELGVENREGLEELPLDEECAGFLERLDAPETVRYWHDSGHAQLKEQLGLLDHAGHLADLGGRLAGFHLHDVTGDGQDHRAPGDGVIDFGMLARFVRPEHTVVLELSPGIPAEGVARGRDHLGRLLAAAPAG